MTHKSMTRFINSRYDSFVDDLKTIVNIDSSGENPEGIKKVARFFKKRFEAIGFDTSLLSLGKTGVPCLESRNRSSRGPFDIMFLGHMDTVFPRGEVEKRHFALSGRTATGPGVCDMKGGLLVALHTLEALHHQGILGTLSVCAAFNGDEETGSRASREWIETTARKSSRVFVFEPCRPGYRFVLRRKGGGWFHVTVKGKAAHAGADPDKGANAVVELAHQAIAINSELNDPETGTSAQVTVISGGNKINIIPDKAVASVDVRILSLSEKDRVENFFKTLPNTTHVKGNSVSVQGSIDRPPMEPDQETLKLWELFKSESHGIGLEIDSISTGGCSDGNFTSALGRPTIDGMGLVGANAHRPDEYVELDSITDMVRLTASICRSLAHKT